jgi:hypothetical protein
MKPNSQSNTILNDEIEKKSQLKKEIKITRVNWVNLQDP